MARDEDKHDPETLWRVQWFDRSRFWDIECQAPTESLARLFSRKALSSAEGIPERRLTHIKTEIITESKFDG